MLKLTGKNANVLIACSDPRSMYRVLEDEIKEKLGIGESFSSITATGGIKFFLNEGLMDKLFKQLGILVDHFAPEKIILLNHLDCGYYKSLGFMDLSKMREEMIKDIKETSKLIKEKFPTVIIEGYILNHEDGSLETIKL